MERENAGRLVVGALLRRKRDPIRPRICQARKANSHHDEDLVAPVELISLPRRKRERDISFSDLCIPSSLPAPRIASHRIVATFAPSQPRLAPAPTRHLADGGAMN